MASKLKVVFMGTSEFAVPSLEHLVLGGYQVAAVYTRPDKPAGRGLALVSSPVKIKALSLGLKVIEPESLRSEVVVAGLARFHPDLIVVAAYAKLLTSSVLKIPGYGCVNVHPSLLPRHRGPAPVAAAILSGDEVSGVSIMLMDKGFDTGPVLSQCQFPVADTDTTTSLTQKLSLVAADLLSKTLHPWVSGALTPKPQDESRATCSSPLSRKDGEIDWMLPALTLWRQVRAFQPWPGAFTGWRGKKLKIISALPLPKAGASEAGRVIGLDEPSGEAPFGVITGDGVLGVRELQLEGKRIMSAAEFMRGQRGFVGSVLPG
ncbi:MAG: methionyl-tRNA formyltransferase [Chloroflexota bacterium]